MGLGVKFYPPHTLVVQRACLLNSAYFKMVWSMILRHYKIFGNNYQTG